MKAWTFSPKDRTPCIWQIHVHFFWIRLFSSRRFCLWINRKKNEKHSNFSIKFTIKDLNILGLLAYLLKDKTCTYRKMCANRFMESTKMIQVKLKKPFNHGKFARKHLPHVENLRWKMMNIFNLYWWYAFSPCHSIWYLEWRHWTSKL